MAAVKGFYRTVRLMLLGQKYTETRSWDIAVRSLSRAAAEPEPDIDQHQEVNQTFVNRNPRNLEQLSVAVKDRGWATVWPKREYYHRLVLKRSNHYVSAMVLSRDSDVPVVTCSTQEWAVKKQLSSMRSVAACRAVGDILAQRCCEAGITQLFYREVPWTFHSDAIQMFWTAMKEGGVVLSEPRRKFI